MHVRWSAGGEARVVAIDAVSVVLRSTVPSPPGSRIEGAFIEAPSTRVRVKIHASKKQPEGDFLLQGRPIDMTRETRERLEKLVAPEAETSADAARPAQGEQHTDQGEADEGG
jgi:hypothetical protein